jgi:hypothetical protein
VAKTKKMTARELAKKQHDEKLVEFAKRAKALCEEAEAGEKSTLALGKLLLKVKTYNPHGGLRKWIVKNIGSDVSTRNRCNYAMRLARRKPETKKAVQGEHTVILKKIRTALRAILDSIETGDLTDVSINRDIVVTAMDALVKRAEVAAFSRNRKEYLENRSHSSTPEKRIAREKALAAEFPPEKAVAASV